MPSKTDELYEPPEAVYAFEQYALLRSMFYSPEKSKKKVSDLLGHSLAQLGTWARKYEWDRRELSRIDKVIEELLKESSDILKEHNKYFLGMILDSLKTAREKGPIPIKTPRDFEIMFNMARELLGDKEEIASDNNFIFNFLNNPPQEVTHVVEVQTTDETSTENENEK